MLASPSQYRAAAKEKLSAAEKPGRVILYHTGVTLLLTLLLTLADHLLDQQIATTGGLSGLGERAILATTQYVFRLLPMVLLPFWQSGYTYYSLQVARGQARGSRDLLEGFRRFGPILRLNLLAYGIIIALSFASSYVGSSLFMLTPWSVPMLEDMEAFMAASPEMTDTEFAEAFLSMVSDSMVPMMIMLGICFLVGGALLFYRLRLAELWLLDHPGTGALSALLNSGKRMKGSCIGMLKLDLSFLWYFLLELLVCVLGMGDTILDAFGISMTTDAFVSYLIFLCLYLWAQLMLYWWKKNEVAVTYANAYLTLCSDESKTTV